MGYPNVIIDSKHIRHPIETIATQIRLRIAQIPNDCHMSHNLRTGNILPAAERYISTPCFRIILRATLSKMPRGIAQRAALLSARRSRFPCGGAPGIPGLSADQSTLHSELPTEILIVSHYASMRITNHQQFFDEKPQRIVSLRRSPIPRL